MRAAPSIVAPALRASLAVLVVALSGACGAEPAPPAAAPGAAPASSSGPTYVGRLACVACHAEVDARFAGSHHDLAMDVANDATVLGAFDGRTLTYDGVTTTFRRDGDAFVVETDGADGALAEFRVSHVFGAVPLQQYMVTFENGRRQMLRQAWDTRPLAEGGQRWFSLYPDEHIPPSHALHWTRPSQTWNHMCAECHSTDLVKGYDRATGRYDTRCAEIDVSCETCHGPCSEHVAWAEELGDAYDPFVHEVEGLLFDVRAPEREWEIDPATGTAIVTKRKLPSPQIETCARCHSRRGQVALEPVLGQPLLQTHRLALLDEGLYHADGQIDDEVFVLGSFLQSRMYAAGVECSDCHEPHTLALRKPGNELCVACHDAARFDVKEHHFHEMGTESALCVVCHMRSKTYMVVDPRRDHSLRVPRPDLTLSIGTPNACDDCHADKGTAWSVEAMERWYGVQERPRHAGEVLAFGRRGGPGAAEALARLAGDPEAAGIVRATALSLLAGSPGHPVVARAVREATGDPDALVRLGATRALAALDPAQIVELGAPLLRDDVRTVRIDAASALVGAPADLVPADVRRDLAAALVELRAANELNADQPEGCVNLGNLERALGNDAAAEALYREAALRDDTFVPAYVNLADLLRAQGRDAAGERILRDALLRFPDDGALNQSLGLLLVRTGRHAEAEAPLEIAASSHRDAVAEMMHALLVQRGGDGERALALLNAAAGRHPGSRDLASALVGAHMQRAEVSQALRWAERLLALQPGDERVQRLVRDLRAPRER